MDKLDEILKRLAGNKYRIRRNREDGTLEIPLRNGRGVRSSSRELRAQLRGAE